MPPQVREQLGITEAEEARRSAAWRQMHDDQATWSTRSHHEILDDAGHYIHVDRPDVVIRAVGNIPTNCPPEMCW